MPAKHVTINDYPVRNVEVDTSLPEADAARVLLETLGRHAEPILKERGWTVLRLTEIRPDGYKKHPNVVGWCTPRGDKNTAEEIQIMLRNYPRMSLRGFDYVIGTMLHELSHIVHGEHRAPFYRLMDELKEDWSRLLATGRVLDEHGLPVSGGHRTSDVAVAPPPSLAFGGRGQRLGGRGRGRGRGLRLGRGRKLGHGANSRSWTGLSLRERAARAADRRAADEAAGLAGDEMPWPSEPQPVPLDLVGAFEEGLAEAARVGIAVAGGLASESSAPGRATKRRLQSSESAFQEVPQRHPTELSLRHPVPESQQSRVDEASQQRAPLSQFVTDREPLFLEAIQASIHVSECPAEEELATQLSLAEAAHVAALEAEEKRQLELALSASLVSAVAPAKPSLIIDID